jgi:integrase
MRLVQMAESGQDGYLVPAPAAGDPEVKWDQSNSSAAMRKVLTGAGFPWAVPHTFRRTVATLLHEGGTPIARIAEQLGRSDPGLTARVYLGRDFGGDKSDLGALL